MTGKYDLLTEDWIPVITREGVNKNVSLERIFVETGEIKEIYDPSPLTILSLHRFLLAILYRVYGKPTKTLWKKLWRDKEFDGALKKYLTKYKGMFDLFSETTPFYQLPTLDLRNSKSINILSLIDSATNNDVLYTHSAYLENNPKYTPAETARLLITYQHFTANSGRSETGYTGNAPLADSIVFLVKGKNLYETLLLNLADIPKSRLPFEDDDIPVWERGTWQPTNTGEYPAGVADLYTWPVRAIKLFPEKDEESGLYCRFCYMGQGISLKGDFYDPMQGFNKKTDSKGIIGIFKWKFREGRALWRDSASIFSSIHFSETKLPPLALWWVSQVILGPDELLTADYLNKIEAYGYAKKEPSQPTIDFWRRESFPLPLAYLDVKNGPDLVNQLNEGLDLAEKVGSDLRFSALVFARLITDGDNQKPTAPLGGQAETDAKGLSGSLGVDRAYWSRLEIPFREMLVNIPGDGESAIKRWAQIIRNTAYAALNEAVADAGSSAKNLKAGAIAESILSGKLSKLLGEYLLMEVTTDDER